jgi:hypothetical protein
MVYTFGKRVGEHVRTTSTRKPGVNWAQHRPKSPNSPTSLKPRVEVTHISRSSYGSFNMFIFKHNVKKFDSSKLKQVFGDRELRDYPTYLIQILLGGGAELEGS